MLATSLAAAALAAAGHGTCGYQCTADADCTGCGTAGKCSSPASSTKYPTIAASCTSEPGGAPATPAADVALSVWPSQFTADVDTWTYSDFTSKTSVAKGKFFYDSVGGHSRGEWHPYINGKDATQVWIGATGSAKSDYYVLSGKLCLYFPITDPGASGSVSVERPTWMQDCDKAGFAKYIGREQVDGEWADHYACVIDYAAANQTIVFQNWHSIGAGKTAAGLPVRVTAGNSAPNGQQGSPRLNTAWYTNFTTGPTSVSPSDFQKPKGLCIPVAAGDAAEHFGVKEVTREATADADFQRRAHYLPHARPEKADLTRAARVRPRKDFSAATLSAAMSKLNAALRGDDGLNTRPCAEFAVAELHQLQRDLFAARSTRLQQVYRQTDKRRLPHSSLSDLAASQKEQVAAAARSDLFELVRDGLCHEAVMTYVHHLTESAREELKSGAAVLPLLPEHELHSAPAADATAQAAHAKYTDQVSCAICHVS
eukprot:TRINITY_DN46900_c0_g1_i1.p2 TRINITY_DN46900_c0_g1~~TRINITY_DN46900_c0_g1_i1.p2  ORF type:complete len:485 (+),score=178.93 TRINITY_DN46900_c0_g1_i1:70-1524(+)